MTTVPHSHSLGSMSSLTERLNRFTEAGIDPAFDGEMEELERQFAELRLTFNQ